MPFVKGQSGNPAGRKKKGTTLTDLLMKKLGDDSKFQNEDGTFKTKNDLLAEKFIELALEGDMPAIKEIYNRIDGKPHQTIETDNTTRVENTDLSKLSDKDLKAVEEIASKIELSDSETD